MQRRESQLHQPNDLYFYLQFEFTIITCMKKRIHYILFLSFISQIALAQVSISGIVNSYTSVLSIDDCTNSLVVSSAAGFSAGDRVLIIQMKGADVNLTNTASFGNITSYNEAGNYEFGTIASVAGTSIILENEIERNYNTSAFVQLIRVANYNDADVDGVLTAASWNGTTGGVLVIEADVLTLNADIDVSGKGFRGGNGGNFPESCPFGTGSSVYFSDTLSGKGGEKGEGIVILSSGYLACRGKAVNGGGGGNDHNAGAGGGGNGANGGVAGENDEPMFSCPGSPGLGGIALDQTMATDKIFLGGGGGAGHGNNTNGTDGGNGGGIIIIRANQIIGNTHSIISNGATVTDLAWGDGAGGGGAGGSILIISPAVSAVSLLAKGGKGGDTGADQCTGPGGGGSGGVIKHSGAAIWPGVTTDLTGGLYGTNTTVTSPCYGENNGASSGANGTIISSLLLAESALTFNGNFAFAGNDTTICNGASLNLNASGGSTYTWSPAIYLDNPFISNPECSPLTTTTYVLEVSNASGCTDYDTITIAVAAPVIADAGDDITICSGESTILNASGGINYLWSPGLYLDNIAIANPECTAPSDITYYVTVTDANGCSGMDSVFVDVSSSDFLYTIGDISTCGDAVVLFAGGGAAYVWSPSTYLDDATSATPLCTPLTDITYYVSSISVDGCEDMDTVNVFIAPGDFLTASEDITICGGGSTDLFASGGEEYVWSPATYLDDPFSPDPVCTPLENITYYVTSINADGCEDIDTVNVFVSAADFASTVEDVNVCHDASVELNSAGGINYTWSPDIFLDDATSANPICTPPTNMTYYVTVENAEGCFDIDTVFVNVLPEVIAVAGPDTVLCVGDPLKLHAEGGVSYLWTPATYLENDTIANPNCFPEATITYIVYVTDANGCTSTDTVDIEINPLTAISNSGDVTICRGDSTTLFAEGGVNYIWTPEPVVPCDPPCAEIIVAPTSTTEYIVQGFDANGCYDIDTITVTVDICQGVENNLLQLIQIYPNPAKDIIYISAPAGLKLNHIEVLNLLGEKINATIIEHNNLMEVQLPELPSQQIIIRLSGDEGTISKMIYIYN